MNDSSCQLQQQSVIHLENGNRRVIVGDALAFINAQSSSTFGEGACVITSMPDGSEMKSADGSGNEMGRGTEYSNFLSDTAGAIVKNLARGTVAIFVQTDLRSAPKMGSPYFDKSFWVTKGATDVGGVPIFHKIALRGASCSVAGNNNRNDDDDDANGADGGDANKQNQPQQQQQQQQKRYSSNWMVNPSFSHVMCFAGPRSKMCHNSRNAANVAAAAEVEKNHRQIAARRGRDGEHVNDDEGDREMQTMLTPEESSAFHSRLVAKATLIPDIILDGAADVDWSRGLSATTAATLVTFVRDACLCKKIVAPFCGTGAVLAAAHLLCPPETQSVGIELCAKRAKRALTLEMARRQQRTDNAASAAAATAAAAAAVDGSGAASSVAAGFEFTPRVGRCTARLQKQQQQKEEEKLQHTDGKGDS